MGEIMLFNLVMDSKAQSHTKHNIHTVPTCLSDDEALWDMRFQLIHFPKGSCRFDVWVNNIQRGASVFSISDWD